WRAGLGRGRAVHERAPHRGRVRTDCAHGSCRHGASLNGARSQADLTPTPAAEQCAPYMSRRPCLAATIGDEASHPWTCSLVGGDPELCNKAGGHPGQPGHRQVLSPCRWTPSHVSSRTDKLICPGSTRRQVSRLTHGAYACLNAVWDII